MPPESAALPGSQNPFSAGIQRVKTGTSLWKIQSTPFDISVFGYFDTTCVKHLGDIVAGYEMVLTSQG